MAHSLTYKLAATHIFAPDYHYNRVNVFQDGQWQSVPITALDMAPAPDDVDISMEFIQQNIQTNEHLRDTAMDLLISYDL